MKKIQCNIGETDRINRSIIGILLCLAALLDFGRWFYFLVGLILVIEGIIGWCYFPILTEKYRHLFSSKPPSK